MIERSFWRGFPPMLASFCLRALVVQLDLAMVARLGAGALAGYALVSRVAVLDAALTAAIGSVSLIVVSRAQKARRDRKLLTAIWICAALLGLVRRSIGALAYPVLIDWLAHQDPAAEFARSAIFIYISATPIRMVESAAIFVLHSLGRGRPRSGLASLRSRRKGRAQSLPSSRRSGSWAVSSPASSSRSSSVVWALIVIRRIVVTAKERARPRLPRVFLARLHRRIDTRARAAIAVFASFALFASFEADPERNAAPGRLCRHPRPDRAGPCAPLWRRLGFFAMRFSGRSPGELKRLLSALLLGGAPLMFIVAGALALGRDPVGAALYGNLGPWWSSFAGALALSLPLRYAGALLRGALLSRGRIGAVATADSTAPWLVALPLIAVGLSLDQPAVACLSLLVAGSRLPALVLATPSSADDKSGRFASELQLS